MKITINIKEVPEDNNEFERALDAISTAIVRLHRNRGYVRDKDGKTIGTFTVKE